MIRQLINQSVKAYLSRRYHFLQQACMTARETQTQLLQKLLNKANKTEYGKTYGFESIKSYQRYTDCTPVVEYEALFPYIDRMMKGEEDILWPGKVVWYAKSSGTTNDKSKYIPITDDFLKNNLIASSWDTTGIVYSLRPDIGIFAHKNLMMGGALSKYEHNPEVTIGDVSAIMLHRMPNVGRPFYTPDFETALLPDWEEKLKKMTMICTGENVVCFGGVPTWTIVLFEKILEYTGKNDMLEVWPNVKTYIHGGVGFDPYQARFRKFLPTDDFDYLNVYNASEGFFALQDTRGDKNMLLYVNNGVFYEFIPLSELGSENPKSLMIHEVELGQSYAMCISTMSGLWRYLIGDIVEFTSRDPYRIAITGRTKQYINAFGEEVMVANTDMALSRACKETDSIIKDYTVAPVFFEEGSKGRHEWCIEFEKEPQDLGDFEKILDKHLRNLNSDYDAKRFKDIALTNLSIVRMRPGVFHKWMESRGKLGGQHKVPRLANHRRYIDELINIHRKIDVA